MDEYGYVPGQIRTNYGDPSQPDGRGPHRAQYTQRYLGEGKWQNILPGESGFDLRTVGQMRAEIQGKQQAELAAEIPQRFAMLNQDLQEQYRKEAYARHPDADPNDHASIDAEAMRIFAERQGVRESSGAMVIEQPLTVVAHITTSPPHPVRGTLREGGSRASEYANAASAREAIARRVAPSVDVDTFRVLASKRRWDKNDQDAIKQLDVQVRAAARQAGISDAMVNVAVPRNEAQLRQFMRNIVNAADQPPPLEIPLAPAEGEGASAKEPSPIAPDTAKAAETAVTQTSEVASMTPAERPVPDKVPSGFGETIAAFVGSLGTSLQQIKDWWKGLWGKKAESVSGTPDASGPSKPETPKEKGQILSMQFDMAPAGVSIKRDNNGFAITLAPDLWIAEDSGSLSVIHVPGSFLGKTEVENGSQYTFEGDVKVFLVKQGTELQIVTKNNDGTMKTVNYRKK